MRRSRLAAALAAVAAAALAFGPKPALAGAEADSSAWTYVQALSGGSPMDCDLGLTTSGRWTCQTPSAPIVASGTTCIQTVHVDVAGRSVTVPLTGCTAQLVIPSWGWQGTYACIKGNPVDGGCHGAMAAGFALFSFQPVVGAAFVDEPATITDAVCTEAGGHATVTVSGFDGTNAFSMQSTINWLGSCSSVNDLTWTGTFTVA
jgi:hypothetical protein